MSNNLKKIAPNLEMCEKIPQGEFSDSLYVWKELTPAFVCGTQGAIEPKAEWCVCKRRESDTNAIPAPILAEIVVKVENKTKEHYSPNELLSMWLGQEGIYPKFHCPKCQAEITNPVIWGQGWDFDSAKCEQCGYDGDLNTITGHDPDGSVWQHECEEEEE